MTCSDNNLKEYKKFLNRIKFNRTNQLPEIFYRNPAVNTFTISELEKQMLYNI